MLLLVAERKHDRTGVDVPCFRCADSLPGVLCIPSLLAQRVCRDAALCRQDVLQGEKQET